MAEKSMPLERRKWIGMYCNPASGILEYKSFTGEKIGNGIRVSLDGRYSFLRSIASWPYKSAHRYNIYGSPIRDDEKKRMPIQLPEPHAGLKVTGPLIIFELFEVATRKSRNISTYLHQKIFRSLEGENIEGLEEPNSDSNIEKKPARPRSKRNREQRYTKDGYYLDDFVVETDPDATESASGSGTEDNIRSRTNRNNRSPATGFSFLFFTDETSWQATPWYDHYPYWHKVQ
jgi:hypothetical protein